MTEGETHSIAGAATALGSKLIAGLPAQFLALLLVNAAILGLLFWFIDARARHTAAVITQLLQACLQQTKG